METPTVRTLMTPTPRVIASQADTATALALMDELQIRHLPVEEDGRLAGVLSERDIRGCRAFLDHAPGVVGPNVGALCSRDLLIVGPNDPLDEALNAMAARKVGAALVVEGDALVGIVTSVDVCRGFAALLTSLRG